MPYFAIFLLFAPVWTPAAEPAVSAYKTLAATPNLFKCVNARGEVSFQATACPVDARVIWARTVRPDTKAVGPQTRPVAQDKRNSSAPARAPVGRRSSTRAAPASSCDAAKMKRADIRDRQWRTIRFDQLRALDEDVARACSR